MMLSPLRSQLLSTSMLNNQYNPWIPCRAIELSLPISPVVKCAGCTLGLLNRTFKSNENTHVITNKKKEEEEEEERIQTHL